MDSLVTKTKRKDVRRALKLLPPRLDESYDRTMERIESQPKEYSDLGKGVIMWVGTAYEPLSPRQIQHALAVDADMTEICDDDLDDQDALLAACAGLVVLDTETDTLRFVRKSFRSATLCYTRTCLSCSLSFGLRSWARKVLMCQAIGGLRDFPYLLRRIEAVVQFVHSTSNMKRECLWDFLILVTLFVSLPSRESGYRRLVFTRTKALHIRIYGAQLRTATFYRLNHSHPQTHQSMHPHNNSSEDRDMLFAEVILAARTTASAFE